MNITVVFKGGIMNGTEITYEVYETPQDGKVIFVKSNDFGYFGASHQVYVYVQKLHSWVYDHEQEVVNEK